MPRQPAEVPTIPLTFRIPLPWRDRLKRAAHERNTTQTALICEAIGAHLDQLEAEYEALVDEGLALAVEEAMADPANHEFVPLEQVLKERGL